MNITMLASSCLPRIIRLQRYQSRHCVQISHLFLAPHPPRLSRLTSQLLISTPPRPHTPWCGVRCFSSDPDAEQYQLIVESELTRLCRAPAAAFVEAVELPTNESSEKLLKIRHSTAHVLAMAVQKLYPGAKVGTGPWTENGFYYDFAMPEDIQLNSAALKKIKKEMVKIIKQNIIFRCENVSFDEARSRLTQQGETYKLEVLHDLEQSPSSPQLTMYHLGGWCDLCAGPHVDSTGDLRHAAIELDYVAGVYWRGDENNKPMMQRVYGLAWENTDQLEQYRHFQAEAARRDHRVLGKRHDLFSLQQEEAGGGLVFWHPRGARVRRVIEDYWRQKHVEAGYELIYSPHIANINLWHTSGHTEFYSEDMFRPIEVDKDKYIIKPMNCPFHCLVYKNSPKSYRDFPIRWAELGTVYRNERSGTMHGLMRVRGFTQDDAHIFCLPDQLEDEIVLVLDLVKEVLHRFGFFEFEVSLSTRPEHSVGGDDLWLAATKALSGALARRDMSHDVDVGGGAFYGPKIDIRIKDAIGRKWQCSTIQCDFNLPSRFNLEYVASDGTKKVPVMIHRAIFGSLERFFGILLETCVGEFPLFIAPEQLRILMVTDDALPMCQAIQEKGRKEYGLRIEIDQSGERLPKQIRNAEMSRVPLMAVVGKTELATADGVRAISVRSRTGVDLGAVPSDFLLAALRRVIDKDHKSLY